MEATQNIAKFNSLTTMLAALPDDAACRSYLEQKIWNGTPTCPYCKCTKAYTLKTKGVFKGMYKCGDCKQRYTVTIGTMFEGSHVPLRKWFIAIYIFSLHKKGISSHQLASDLGVTQKTAWFMLSRIRQAFSQKDADIKQDGCFQADETFIGGKNKNRHADKKVIESQGRSVKDKTPVFGLLQSGGKVRTAVITDTKASTIKPIIKRMVAEGAIIITDEWVAYKGLASTHSHVVLNHKENEYVRGGFHNNGIENFWSHLKRGIYGIYHHVSPKHLTRYCDEFAFRYNARKESVNERFDYSLLNSTKLTYKKLTSKIAYDAC